MTDNERELRVKEKLVDFTKSIHCNNLPDDIKNLLRPYNDGSIIFKSFDRVGHMIEYIDELADQYTCNHDGI